MKKILIVCIIMMMLLAPLAGASNIISIKDTDIEKQVTISNEEYTHSVLVEGCTQTWCPPCVKEIPHFVELHEQYKDKGVEILGISLDHAGVSVVKAFVEKFQIKYPIMMTDGKIDKAFGGIPSIPTTFLIDSSGNIIRKYVGYNSKAVFETDIKKLLAQAK